ncbi:MAG: Npun_R2821/Npun_R2822 family protein, partial [Microcystaceae cyanobacterium]
LIDREKRNLLLEKLQAKESEILYPMAPDQTLINYMMMRSHYSIFNFALHLAKDKITGCCATSPHFTIQDNILYDKNNRLTYLHYIGLSSNLFTRVCQGENITFPYRDLFLHYRYLSEPEKRPQFTMKAKLYNQPPSLSARIKKKLGLTK